MIILDRLKNYCLNTTLHGLRFIADSENSFVERVMWLCFCITSWYFATIIIIESWTLYKTGCISFVVETDYLEWDVDFPSVTLCEMLDEESKNGRIVSFMEEMYPEQKRTTKLYKAINEISFFRGDINQLKKCYKNDEYDTSIGCPMDNMSLVSSQIRRPCAELLGKCRWNNNDPFDCCKHFLPLRTDIGVCYAINSEQTRRQKGKFYPMKSNRETGPGTFQIEVKAPTELHLHSKYDVPTMDTPYVDVAVPGAVANVLFTLQYTVNEPNVKVVDIEKRNCRFPEENNIDIYKFYSQTACWSQCRKENTMRICNCTTHNTPGQRDTPECTLDGLLCFGENNADLMSLKLPWSTEAHGIQCSYCVQACEEINIKYPLHDYYEEYESEDIGSFKLMMASLPTERYIRKVVRDNLDMVVSTGSTLGLFFGASLLSIAEIFHYFFLRRTDEEREVMRNEPRQQQTTLLDHGCLVESNFDIPKKKPPKGQSFYIQVREALMN